MHDIQEQSIERSKESNGSVELCEKSYETMLKNKGDMVNTMVPRGDSVLIKIES